MDSFLFAALAVILLTFAGGITTARPRQRRSRQL